MSPRVLAFAGSTRQASLNKKLVRVAAQAAERAGAQVTLIDLADYPLPIFDEDLEAAQGLPEHAIALKDLFKTHDALLIASPEYNGSITAVLKNTIDWITRPRQDEAPLECFKGKVAGLLAASPGTLGGIRALPHVATILRGIGVLVIPTTFALPGAHKAFDDSGDIGHENHRTQAEAVGATLAQTTARLICPAASEG